MNLKALYFVGFLPVAAGLLFSTLDSASAQTTVTNANRRYFQKIWQMDEGLPHNVVTTILQSRDGFLWIGTLNGLVRFDGIRFETFKLKGVSGRGANRILKLHEDRSGTLWIGTEGGGLAWMKNDQHGVFTRQDGLSHNRVDPIADDADGAIWAGTFGGGVNRIQNGQITFFGGSNGPAGKRITGIVSDSHSNLWFNTTQVLSRLENGKFVTVRTHAAESGIIAQCRPGGVWLASSEKIQRLDATGVVYDSGLLSWKVKRGEIRSLLEDHNGTLWIGTHGNDLFRFHDGQLEQLDTPHNNILALCEGADGNLWVGSEGGGLNRLRSRAFVVYDPAQGLPKDVVFSISATAGEAILVVPQAAGLWKFSEGHFAPFDLGIADEPLITCAVSGRDGSVWVGTENAGLFQWANGNLKRFTRQQGLAGDDVRAILIAQTGDVWVGTFKHGVSRVSNGKIFNFSRRNGLSGNGIRALAEDHLGNIWAGNAKGGVDRISHDAIRSFTALDGLPGATIRTIYGTEDDGVWIGTAGSGLLRFKNERFFRITTADGLQSDDISQILSDDAGYLWFGGGQGIFRVEKSSLDDLADGKSKRIKSIAYGKSEGLASIQFTHGYHPAACKASDGQLWFSTTKGALRLDPAATEMVRAAARVYLTAAQLDGRKIPLGEHFQIPPGNHHLAFEFTSPNFVAPEQVAFRYVLAGLDREWIYPHSQRSAEYSQLPPGEYVFRVCVRDASGIWKDGQAAQAFSVLPMYWQTLWFRAIALFLFIAATVFIVRFFLRRRYQRELRFLEQQHALERERTRIAKDMHDDVGASLTQIAFLSELAQKELDSPQSAGLHLRRIGQRSREVVQALDEIVWAVNPRNDPLEKSVEYLSHFVDDYLKTTGIRCHQDLPDTLPNFTMSSEYRHNLFLIVKEALNNAVKHSAASTLWFRAGVSDSTLKISIEDDGHGFFPEAGDNSGEGLKNMRERTAQLGGTFRLESSPGKGTKIDLNLPLARFHC